MHRHERRIFTPRYAACLKQFMSSDGCHCQGLAGQTIKQLLISPRPLRGGTLPAPSELPGAGFFSRPCDGRDVLAVRVCAPTGKAGSARSARKPQGYKIQLSYAIDDRRGHDEHQSSGENFNMESHRKKCPKRADYGNNWRFLSLTRRVCSTTLKRIR